MACQLDLTAAREKRSAVTITSTSRKEEVLPWGDPDSNPIATGEWEDDLDRSCTLVPFASATPMPTHWRFVLGDAIGNYRAALDYAACALVLVESGPPERRPTARPLIHHLCRAQGPGSPTSEFPCLVASRGVTPPRSGA